MKRNRIPAAGIAALLLLCLVGCSDANKLPEASLNYQAGVLTVDGNHYLRDESLVCDTLRSNLWFFGISDHEQIASVKDESGSYLLNANKGERRFLFGH